MRRLIAAAAVLLMSTHVLAQDFSYDYLELSAVQQKNNENGDKIQAGFLDLSWQSEVGALLRLRLGYGEADELSGRDPADLGLHDGYSYYGLLVGGARQINERLSAWFGVDVSRERHATQPVGGTTHFNRYGAELGFRAWLVPRVEVNARAGVFHRENRRTGADGEDAELGLELRLYPLRRLSLGVGASHWVDDRVEAYWASLRWDY